MRKLGRKTSAMTVKDRRRTSKDKNRMNVIDTRRLRQLKALSALTSDQVGRLAASLSVEAIKRKKTVFEEGQLADAIYLLLSGVVRIAWVNHEGRQVSVTLLPAGVFLAAGPLFPPMRYKFRCEAFTDCLVGAMKPDVLVDILFGIPLERFVRGMDLTLGRLWATLERSVQGAGLSLQKRVASELLELGALFGVEDARGTILSVRPTHEDLANSIGVSRQRVTQCLSNFERHRAVVREGRRLIIVPRRLREIVEKD